MHLVHDATTNTLHLRLDHDQTPVAARTERVSGIIDVAEGGRLVGIELMTPNAIEGSNWLRNWATDPIAGKWLTIEDGRDAYLQLTTGDDRHARTTQIELVMEFDGEDQLLAIGIPRRGAGYEISYPSGNQ